MKILRWKISIAFFTFCISTVLLILYVYENKPLPQISGPETNPSEIGVEPNIPLLVETDITQELLEKKHSLRSESSGNKIEKDIKRKSVVKTIKDGGEYCEKYILRKIGAEKSSNNKLIKLKSFNSNAENLSPNVKKWLGFMRLENLKVSQLKTNKQNALLLSSTALAATGLSTSLENWHIEIDNFYSEGFWSFSRNPKLIFWDKTGRLNYYLVDYSDDFLSATSKRDYDNLTFNIERYRINSEGKTEIISKEINLRCN